MPDERPKRIENLKAIADLAAEVGESSVAMFALALAGTVAADDGSENQLRLTVRDFTKQNLLRLQARQATQPRETIQ